MVLPLLGSNVPLRLGWLLTFGCMHGLNTPSSPSRLYYWWEALVSLDRVRFVILLYVKLFECISPSVSWVARPLRF